PVIGTAVVYARLGRLCVDPHGLSNERLEQLPEERSVSGRSVRRPDGHELRTAGDAAEQCPHIHPKQSRSQCWINQVVLRSLGESPQVVLRRHPAGDLIENPQLLEYIAIGDDGGFGWDFLCTRRGGVANLFERCGGGCGRRECRHPTAEGLRPAYRVPLRFKVAVNDSLEVSVELRAQRPA